MKHRTKFTFILIVILVVGSLAHASPIYVVHGGGNVGAAQGGVIGVIDSNTYAYTPLTSSLGSLTGLVYDGTALYTYEANSDSFLQVDPITGNVLSAVARSGGADLTDLAILLPGGNAPVFGVDINYDLFAIDLNTGSMTQIGTLPHSVGGFQSIAIDPNQGEFYAHNANSPGQFYTISLTDGSILTTVQGGVPGGTLGLGYLPMTRLLIASECCDSPDGSLGERLFSINPTTGVATLLVDFNDGRRMQDFAIPGMFVVPEPSTMLLFTAGLSLICAVRFRGQ
ncbi:MAG: PEP-CTERM sorting domain-containing protein [Acidobacteria bacterium]|nr:PEP-CTERM sorting domain-containing protein [Acidobacteriota bacterium]